MHFNIQNLISFHLLISILQMTSTFYLFKDRQRGKKDIWRKVVNRNPTLGHSCTYINSLHMVLTGIAISVCFPSFRVPA